MVRTQTQTELAPEVEQAAIAFGEARAAWMKDTPDAELEKANHQAYSDLWAAARGSQKQVIEALRFIGLYRDK